MNRPGREARLVGSGSVLANAVAERLAKLGHRVTRREDLPGDDPEAELLIHLDSTLDDPPEPVELEEASIRARKTYTLIERTVLAMRSRSFGRIVHVRSAPPPRGQSMSGALDAFASGGTVRMLQDLAREVARFGITLNIVILRSPSSDGDPPGAPREATVGDVAGLLEMLCSDEAGFLTAQSFSMVCRRS